MGTPRFTISTKCFVPAQTSDRMGQGQDKRVGSRKRSFLTATKPFTDFEKCGYSRCYGLCEFRKCNGVINKAGIGGKQRQLCHEPASICPLVAASEHWWRSPRRRRTEVPMSPHWGGIRVAARTGRVQAKIPGRPRMEVSRLPQWGGILVA